MSDTVILVNEDKPVREITCNEYGYMDAEGLHLEESDEYEGYIFYKNIEAFESKEGICYAFAPSDDIEDISTFTYKDFLDEAMGNEELACGSFEMIAEMCVYIDTYYELCMEEDWIVQCNDCMYVYEPGVESCPKCGSHHLTDDRLIEEVKVRNEVEVIDKRRFVVTLVSGLIVDDVQVCIGIDEAKKAFKDWPGVEYDEYTKNYDEYSCDWQYDQTKIFEC